jgi:hypothetical protein
MIRSASDHDPLRFTPMHHLMIMVSFARDVILEGGSEGGRSDAQQGLRP